MKSSSESEKNADFLLIGKIVGVHGVAGTVKILSYAESPDIFKAGDSVFLREPAEGFVRHMIDWAKPRKNTVLVSIKDVASRDAAQFFVGRDVYIETAGLDQPEEDTYYWFDLIGLEVRTGEGRILGRLERVIPTGSNDVYEVIAYEGNTPVKEVLVPALASVVLAVDLKAGIMVVDLPEGLE